MPYQLVAPEVAFTVTSGEWVVEVFHTYKNNQIDELSSYWYTLDRHENDEAEFDIRTLAQEIGWVPTISNLDEHKAILQMALDKGHQMPMTLAGKLSCSVISSDEIYQGAIEFVRNN